MFIKNNEHSSKNILNYLFLFDELLKNHQLETIEIFVICLKNIFYKNINQINNNMNYYNDYISPSLENENMKKFDILTSTQYWIKKIKEIDEINNNILAQIMYLKVLKRLCLNAEGSGILKNQMEITKDLYKNNYLILKFGIDHNNKKPYVIFNLIDDNIEFFIQNPSLNEIKIVENINTANLPMFYYSSFSNKYEIFINYICAVLDLYYASCASRNDTNKHIMIDYKNAGLSIQHIYLVITDNNINVKIRKRYSRLFRVLFVDSSPRERISINRMKIFIWNSEINENDDIFQHIYKWIGKDINNKKIKGGKNQNKDNDNLAIFRYYINDFFNSKDFFYNLIEKSENYEGRNMFNTFLGFLEEILFLTKESLDFGLWAFKDIIILIQNINIFFIVFNFFKKKSNLIKIETDLHNYDISMFEWNNTEKINDCDIKKLIQNKSLAKLVYYCLKSKNNKIKNRLYQIYDKILDIYQIFSMIKEDCEKYLFMREYKNWYNSGESLLNNVYMIKLYNTFIKWEDSQIFCLDNEKKNEKDYEILNDNYLLQILLLDELNNEFTEYKLYNKSFSTMINHLNRQNNFINELSKLEIIVNDEDLKIFESLIKTDTFIQKQKQNIEAIQISKNVPIQIFDIFKKSDKNNLIYDEKINNNKNRDIINIIEDLTNIIDSGLIKKMKLQNNSKLNKIQNFCQILNIHESLIDLLNFLLNYVNKSNIFHKIFQFLYHFCYKNWINQRLLKKNFDSFLLLMPRFNYIEKVLMEILNLYKERKKSHKYIMKIFQQIKKLDLICPEIIKILISIMFNNKKKNFSSNQIFILQNFNDILKDNFFREFLKESIIMEYTERIKSQVGDYTQIEKEFNSYLNILEIFSFTCFNNKYCIVNCRQLLSIEELITILKSYNYPYKLKTYLLLFFKNVYFPYPTFKDIKLYDIKYFFDILENFILKELILFYFYSIYFLERYLIKKGVEPNDEFIRDNQNCSNAYSLIINFIEEEPEIKDYLILQKINIDSLENTKSLFGKNKYISKNKKEEYMKFFFTISDTPFLEVQGLISFLYHIYIYIKDNKLELDNHQKEILLLTKKRLNKIEDLLEKIENELVMDDLIIDIEYHIQKCLSIFKYQDNEILYDKPKYLKNKNKKKLNKNEIQKIEKNAQQVLNMLKEYINLNETNLMRVFNLPEYDSINEIEKMEFIRTMKKIINNQINNEEILDTIKFLDKNDKGIINLKNIYIYFNKNNKNKRYKTEQNISEYLNVNSKLDDKSFKISFIFKHYLFLFDKMQKQIDYNYSLKSIISLLYSENNIGNLILFFSRILEYINRNENKKKEKLYFFQFIYNIINDKLYDSLEKDKKVINERIEVTKLIFCHSGIIEYILKNVYKDNNLEIIYKCLCTLNLCLAKGNKNVQNTLYNYVSYKKNSYNFLSCLEWILSETFDYIKSKNEIFLNNDIKIDNNNDLEMTQYLKQDLRKKEINILTEITSEKIPVFLLKDNSFIYKLPRLVLLFIQLCSDNNENFQHFFRDNEYDKNLNDIILNNDDNIIIKEKGNINLINDIGTLLIKVLNLGNLIYYNYDIWRLTKDLVITLTNLCEGPCEQNQIILGLRKAIFSSINILLQREYNLQNKEEINTRKNLLLCYIINFIKSLISPKSLISIGEILLETIDIYLLIEKLIDIYSIIIEPNEKLLYNGEICNHIKDSENNYINKNNYLDKCEKNQCKKNYLLINEMEFIKTGFNLFIILTNLKDNFPNHQKLSLFDINLEKTKHSQFLKVNQIQKRNLKENNKSFRFDKKEFSDESKNNLLFNMSEIIDFDKTYFKNNFENESETKKALDNTEFIYSDMNIKEISFLEENFCQRFIKFISCGIFRRNKKNINKSYELYQKI